MTKYIEEQIFILNKVNRDITSSVQGTNLERQNYPVPFVFGKWRYSPPEAGVSYTAQDNKTRFLYVLNYRDINDDKSTYKIFVDKEEVIDHPDIIIDETGSLYQSEEGVLVIDQRGIELFELPTGNLPDTESSVTIQNDNEIKDLTLRVYVDVSNIYNAYPYKQDKWEYFLSRISLDYTIEVWYSPEPDATDNFTLIKKVTSTVGYSGERRTDTGDKYRELILTDFRHELKEQEPDNFTIKVRLSNMTGALKTRRSGYRWYDFWSGVIDDDYDGRRLWDEPTQVKMDVQVLRQIPEVLNRDVLFLSVATLNEELIEKLQNGLLQVEVDNPIKHPADCISRLLLGSVSGNVYSRYRERLSVEDDWGFDWDALNDWRNNEDWLVYNGIFDVQDNLINIIDKQILSAYGGKLVIKGDLLSVVLDRHQQSNDDTVLIDEKSSLSHSFNAEEHDLATLPTGVKVAYFNEQKKFQEDAITVYQDGYNQTSSIFEDEISITGLTSVDEYEGVTKWSVEDFGRYYLYSKYLVRQTDYNIVVDRKYLDIEIGDLIRYQHDQLREEVKELLVAEAKVDRNFNMTLTCQEPAYPELLGGVIQTGFTPDLSETISIYVEIDGKYLRFKDPDIPTDSFFEYQTYTRSSALFHLNGIYHYNADEGNHIWVRFPSYIRDILNDDYAYISVVPRMTLAECFLDMTELQKVADVDPLRICPFVATPIIGNDYTPLWISNLSKRSVNVISPIRQAGGASSGLVWASNYSNRDLYPWNDPELNITTQFTARASGGTPYDEPWMPCRTKSEQHLVDLSVQIRGNTIYKNNDYIPAQGQRYEISDVNPELFKKTLDIIASSLENRLDLGKGFVWNFEGEVSKDNQYPYYPNPKIDVSLIIEETIPRLYISIEYTSDGYGVEGLVNWKFTYIQPSLFEPALA